ncbi:MAG TPA: alpha/beta hydrolase [Chitinophagaceae bacterium]|nr:alpha/beta hydrolase [Chitinophagaceae bacterium]
MPIDQVNGVKLYWELTGNEGPLLVLVHGSWGDHNNWNAVVGDLSKSFRVLTYDRRGHSKSERREEQGSLDEDASDLIALIEHVGESTAHIAGNSGGAAVALKTAAQHARVFETLVVHEPPLFDLLKGIPEATPYLQAVESRVGAVIRLLENKEMAQGAELFVETIAIGPGGWQQMPVQSQQNFIFNAPTFLDETKDPENLNIDLIKLSPFNKPTLLTQGTESPPFFKMVLDQLAKAIPAAQRKTIIGAGHVPHISHPKEYVDMIKSFCLK